MANSNAGSEDRQRSRLHRCAAHRGTADSLAQNPLKRETRRSFADPALHVPAYGSGAPEGFYLTGCHPSYPPRTFSIVNLPASSPVN